MSARVALIAALVAALGATVEAALHGPPAALAWLAALAAAAFGVAAGAAARALGASDDLREPRHANGPSHPEPLPPDAVSRGVFGRLWAYAAGAFVVLAAVPFVALARRPAPRGTAWSPGSRLVDASGRALRTGDLEVGGIATVFPEHNVGAPESATLLIRLQNDALRTRPGREGWAPDGNVAYSKICTHAGCPVAIYRRESYQLYCPCHQSVFDVLDAARPLSGPATRPLPQLALDVDAQGYLIARGDYGEPVGPDDWWRTV